MIYQDPALCTLKKRSITLAGHRTSVTVEEPYWEILSQAAKAGDVPLSHLIMEIDNTRQCNLSSAIRLFALEWAMEDSQK